MITPLTERYAGEQNALSVFLDNLQTLIRTEPGCEHDLLLRRIDMAYTCLAKMREARDMFNRQHTTYRRRVLRSVFA
jgi:hypothetical protein